MKFLLLVIALSAGIAAGFAGDRWLLAQPQPVRRTVLLEKDLAEAPGKEVDVFLIEMAPGASTGRHSHPGTEIAYILEGSAAVDTGGGATVQHDGEVSYLAPNQAHNVSNPSATGPLKAIVFAIYDKDKPKITPAK